MTSKPSKSAKPAEKRPRGRPRLSAEEKKRHTIERRKRNAEGKGRQQLIEADIIAEAEAAHPQKGIPKPKDLSGHISQSEAINRWAEVNPHPLFGRQPLYKREYCDLAVEHMSKGHSIAGFAGQIGVSANAVENWAEKYPEFGRAIEVARACAVNFWEGQLIALAKGIGGGAPGRAVSIIFGLKNRAPQYWRDIQVIEEKKTVDITVSSTRDRLRARLERIASTSVTIDGEAVPQLEARQEHHVSTSRIVEREIDREAA